MQEINRFRQVVLPVLSAFFIAAVIILSMEWMRLDSIEKKKKKSAPVMEREHMPESVRWQKKVIFRYEPVFILSGKQPFSPGPAVPFRDLEPVGNTWLRAEAEVCFRGCCDSLKCSLVATCNHKGTNYKYMSLPLELLNLKSGQWNRINMDYKVPRGVYPEDLVQVYFWYRGGEEVKCEKITVNSYKTAGEPLH